MVLVWMVWEMSGRRHRTRSLAMITSPLEVQKHGLGARLKVRLVQLHLEAEEKAQVRRAQLELEIHCLETEADKGMRLRKLESQPQASSVSAVLPGSTPTLQWPSDIWPLLLQCKLTGKAQKVVATLPLQDSLNYSSVKSAVFQAYELVPEASGRNFGNRKLPSQTYGEFTREKGILFDK